MLRKDDHFKVNDDNQKSNILYQIEQLIKKYPNTIYYEYIIDRNLKDD